MCTSQHKRCLPPGSTDEDKATGRAINPKFICGWNFLLLLQIKKIPSTDCFPIQNGPCVMEVLLIFLEHTKLAKKMLMWTKKDKRHLWSFFLCKAVKYVFNPIYKHLYLLVWVSAFFFSLCKKFFFSLQSSIPLSKPGENEINMLLHINSAQCNRASKCRVRWRYQVFLSQWLMPSRRNNNYMAQGGGKKACWIT